MLSPRAGNWVPSSCWDRAPSLPGARSPVRSAAQLWRRGRRVVWCLGDLMSGWVLDMLPTRVVTAKSLARGEVLNGLLAIRDARCCCPNDLCRDPTLVLFPSEMRRKFDAGEDPLDAESQQGGGNPFHRNWNTWQGFNPFGSGGGPFTFKFHFS